MAESHENDLKALIESDEDCQQNTLLQNAQIKAFKKLEKSSSTPTTPTKKYPTLAKKYPFVTKKRTKSAPSQGNITLEKDHPGHVDSSNNSVLEEDEFVTLDFVKSCPLVKGNHPNIKLPSHLRQESPMANRRYSLSERTELDRTVFKYVLEEYLVREHVQRIFLE